LEAKVLPFLKNREKQAAGIVMKTRTPDEKPENDTESDDPAAAIKACANSLIRAVHSRDIQGVADAMKDAFDILESSPHPETDEHTNPHSYDAQNKLAGEE